MIQEETLEELTHRHNVLESRDIYRLTLKLNPHQIEELIHRIQEIKAKRGKRYYF